MPGPSSKSKRRMKPTHPNTPSTAAANPSPSTSTSATTAAPAAPAAPAPVPRSGSAKQPATLSLLQHLQSTSALPPSTAAREIYTSQLAHKPLILRPTSPDPASQDARSIRRKKRLSAFAKQRAKRRPKPLSAREKRVLGVYDLELATPPKPRTQQDHDQDQQSGEKDEVAGVGFPGSRARTAADWDVWKGLWSLWCGYVWEVLGLRSSSSSATATALVQRGQQQKQKQQNSGQSVNANANAIPNPNLNLAPAFLGPKISSLDLHGALLRVVKSNSASLVGIWGICVRENKFSVVLVDSWCVVRRVGKRGVVFAVEVPLPMPAPVPVPVQSSPLVDKEEQKNDEEKEEEPPKADGGADLDAFLRGEGARVVFELSGKALECRPIDRATKKFKVRKYDGF